MIRALVRYLTTPSDYARDPRGYVFNQLGHAWVVGAPLGLFGADWVLIAVLAYVAVIEAPQLLLFGGTSADAAEDTGHVALGALAVAISPQIAAIHVLWLICGAKQRHSQWLSSAPSKEI